MSSVLVNHPAIKLLFNIHLLISFIVNVNLSPFKKMPTISHLHIVLYFKK